MPRSFPSQLLVLQLLGCPLEICPWLSAVAFISSLGFPKPVVELSWQPKSCWKEHFLALPENNVKQFCSQTYKH